MIFNSSSRFQKCIHCDLPAQFQAPLGPVCRGHALETLGDVARARAQQTSPQPAREQEEAEIVNIESHPKFKRSSSKDALIAHHDATMGVARALIAGGESDRGTAHIQQHVKEYGNECPSCRTRLKRFNSQKTSGIDDAGQWRDEEGMAEWVRDYRTQADQFKRQYGEGSGGPLGLHGRPGDLNFKQRMQVAFGLQPTCHHGVHLDRDTRLPLKCKGCMMEAQHDSMTQEPGRHERTDAVGGDTFGTWPEYYNTDWESKYRHGSQRSTPALKNHAIERPPFFRAILSHWFKKAEEVHESEYPTIPGGSVRPDISSELERSNPAFRWFVDKATSFIRPPKKGQPDHPKQLKSVMDFEGDKAQDRELRKLRKGKPSGQPLLTGCTCGCKDDLKAHLGRVSKAARDEAKKNYMSSITLQTPANDLISINEERAKALREEYARTVPSEEHSELAKQLLGLGEHKGTGISPRLLGRGLDQFVNDSYSPKLPSAEQQRLQELGTEEWHKEWNESRLPSVKDEELAGWINKLKQERSQRPTRSLIPIVRTKANEQQMKADALSSNIGRNRGETSVTIGELLKNPKFKIREASGETREIGDTGIKRKGKKGGTYQHDPLTTELGRSRAIVHGRLIPDMMERLYEHPILKRAAQNRLWDNEARGILSDEVSNFRRQVFELHHGSGIEIPNSNGTVTKVPSLQVNNTFGPFADRVGERLEPSNSDRHEEFKKAAKNTTMVSSLRTLLTRPHSRLSNLIDTSAVQDIRSSDDEHLKKLFSKHFPGIHPLFPPEEHDIQFLQNALEVHHNGEYTEKPESGTSHSVETTPGIDFSDILEEAPVKEKVSPKEKETEETPSTPARPTFRSGPTPKVSPEVQKKIERMRIPSEAPTLRGNPAELVNSESWINRIPTPELGPEESATRSEKGITVRTPHKFKAPAIQEREYMGTETIPEESIPERGQGTLLKDVRKFRAPSGEEEQSIVPVAPSVPRESEAQEPSKKFKAPKNQMRLVPPTLSEDELLKIPVNKLKERHEVWKDLD